VSKEAITEEYGSKWKQLRDIYDQKNNSQPPAGSYQNRILLIEMVLSQHVDSSKDINSRYVRLLILNQAVSAS